MRDLKASRPLQLPEYAGWIGLAQQPINAFARLRRPSWSGPQFAAGGELFERSEENSGGVPKEEFPVIDVTREHGVGGVSGLLPDLERGIWPRSSPVRPR
jgi:hypothetical protein